MGPISSFPDRLIRSFGLVLTLVLSVCSPAIAQETRATVTGIDRDARTVEASALLLWGAKARFDADLNGCVLE